MSFLYPSFLWALAALSIPVIIHLFNFRKTKRIYFPTNRFLKQVKEATTAKRRLKHYLILAARLLALFFLVIVFAQPIIPAKEQLGNNRNLTLYLDNSLSMSAQLPDKTRGLDAGTQFIKDIVALFPADTRYKLLTNDFAPFSNSYKTKTEVLDLLTEIRLSPVSRNIQEVKDRIHTGQGHEEQEVFWISDFQKSTAGIPKVTSSDSALRWHLVPLQFGSLANIFIDSVYLENPFAAAGEKNTLHVLIRNDSKREADQLNIKLTMNSVQAGAASVTVPARGTGEVTFDLTTGLSGRNRGRITFKDFPISFDNEFFFTLNFTDKLNVFEIKGSALPSPVERVFGNKQLFAYTGFPAGNFNYSLLSRADLVVLNGINAIDASLSSALRSYLDNFGTVLVIPGETPDISTYRGFLQIPSLTYEENRSFVELDKPDFNNPFFENVFEEKTVALAMPRSVPLLNWGSDRSAILRFRNDLPFLSQFDRRGKLYVMSSPMTRSFSDLYNNALFVPIMYRMAASGKKNEAKLYYTLRENFVTVRADSVVGEDPVKLVGKQEILPSQHRVADRILLDIPKFTINQGFYNVVLHRDTIGLLAFNLDKTESLMDQYKDTDVTSFFGGKDNVTLFDASSPNAFSNEIKARYLGKPLWKYALLLSLAFLLMEIVLIRFMK